MTRWNAKCQIIYVLLANNDKITIYIFTQGLVGFKKSLT